MFRVAVQYLGQDSSHVNTDSIPFSCPLNALQQRFPSSNMVKIKQMRTDKLKSTTVRFTDADLHLIDSLQEKLGLGMIQVIRLAIRRLAEIENVDSWPSIRKNG